MTLTAGAHCETDVPSYRVVLAETDWGSLETPFGNGACLPGVLARLLEPDARAQVAALSELGELVGHQNSVYEATAPVATFVAGILAHPAAANRRPYRAVPVRAAMLNWLASTVYDASDEAVDRIARYCPGFLVTGTPRAALRDLRPVLYRAVEPYLRDGDEDVREAAGLAALLLAEHPGLARHREHLAVHAHHILDTSNDPHSRRVARQALTAWGHDVTPIEPEQDDPSAWGPHSDGHGDLNPPF
ncbi:hypothetical protein [Streptomyces sp. NBC_00525]|uniref:hypothetical protein n=1 Tax=Streptomyces sp. NBC_00525 TaxID=2903660 RepID=UPI002E80AB09|nr:hypothetical protein [Streptomyces sp. NBC_00525]WUC95152.1 hypothetical protein OG710_16860 [Streptomyces sp. NBC_00525]